MVTSLRIHQWHSILELDAYEGRWQLRQSLSRRYAGDSRQLWSAPATTGVWTRFFFKVRYSTHPKTGFIRMGVDLNGDGDFADSGELSPRFHTHTLKVETAPVGAGSSPAERSLPIYEPGCTTTRRSPAPDRPAAR